VKIFRFSPKKAGFELFPAFAKSETARQVVRWEKTKGFFGVSFHPAFFFPPPPPPPALRSAKQALSSDKTRAVAWYVQRTTRAPARQKLVLEAEFLDKQKAG
jgi:hypothetical protein